MALQRSGTSIQRQMMSSDPAKAAQGRAMLAGRIAAALSRYEILTSAPAPQNEQAYEVPITRMLGEAMPSGLPPMDGR